MLIQQIGNVQAFQKRNTDASKGALADLKHQAVQNHNIFGALMEAAKVCSLGELTHALYEVGGQYRRSM